MARIRVLRPHASPVGIGVFRVGDVYEENDLAAQQKAAAGFVEFVDGTPVRNKAAPEVYDRISVKPTPLESDVTVTHRRGNWYFFDNGEKVLGKANAAEIVGVDPEELNDVPVDDA